MKISRLMFLRMCVVNLNQVFTSPLELRFLYPDLFQDLIGSSLVQFLLFHQN